MDEEDHAGGLMEEKIRLSQISAVMLGVRDLSRALEFYGKKLGLKAIMQESQLALSNAEP